MPPRIPDGQRAAILADIRNNNGRSTRAIAKTHGVSDHLVRSIAKENGITDAWSREHTKNATDAAITDAKARRAVLAAKFLDKADALLDRIDEEYLVHSFGGRDNDYNEHTLDRPPAGEIRNLMIAAATAFDKHMVQDKHDSDTHGLAAVDEWLHDMLGRG